MLPFLLLYFLERDWGRYIRISIRLSSFAITIGLGNPDISCNTLGVIADMYLDRISYYF